MKRKKAVQSIEPNIVDLANEWLKSYKLLPQLLQRRSNTRRR